MGCKFNPRPFCCRAAILRNSFTYYVPLFSKLYILVLAKCGDILRLGRQKNNGRAYD